MKGNTLNDILSGQIPFGCDWGICTFIPAEGFEGVINLSFQVSNGLAGAVDRSLTIYVGDVTADPESKFESAPQRSEANGGSAGSGGSGGGSGYRLGNIEDVFYFLEVVMLR